MRGVTDTAVWGLERDYSNQFQVSIRVVEGVHLLNEEARLSNEEDHLLSEVAVEVHLSTEGFADIVNRKAFARHSHHSSESPGRRMDQLRP
jgi:hypothetical protein